MTDSSRVVPGVNEPSCSSKASKDFFGLAFRRSSLEIEAAQLVGAT